MLLPIPAIDLIDGKCVRLTQGDYATSKTYAEDPLEVAKAFEDYGFPRLHLVDLDGARSRHVVNLAVLERIATRTGLVIDFGGGIKTETDLHSAFTAGAQMVTIGSLAVKDRQTVRSWGETFGKERFIIGADADADGHICINGWKETLAETIFDIVAFYHEAGMNHVLCTDISRDGMLGGSATNLYHHMLGRFDGLQLIASGGVGSLDDLEALDEAGVPEAVFGKAIYEGRISLADVAKRFL